VSPEQQHGSIDSLIAIERSGPANLRHLNFSSGTSYGLIDPYLCCQHGVAVERARACDRAGRLTHQSFCSRRDKPGSEMMVPVPPGYMKSLVRNG
jgi:hypothetical protein